MILNKEIMQILMLSWEYPPHINGGLGRHVAELAPALANEGIDVHVVTPVGEPSVAQLRGQTVEQFKNGDASDLTGQGADAELMQVEDGVVVHRVLTSHKNTPKDIYTRVTEVNKVLEAYVLRTRAQYGECMLIHTHDWLTAFVAMTLQRDWQCTLLATIHATERGRARGKLTNNLQHLIDHVEQDLIQQANSIIVCSKHMSHELQKFFHTPPPKLHVVPNGVDFAQFQNLPANNLAEFRAKFAAPHQKLVFSVARLVYEKGIHRLVDAALQILDNCPNVKFVVAGKGPEKARLQQQVDYFGIANKFQFIGFISDEDRDRLFKVADCAVFPSLYEPFGIVALEAMALNCPVVVSDVGGLAEVVTHRKTGLTVYADDPKSIAWGVIQSLTKTEWTAEQVINARQWVDNNFTWPQIAALTHNVYRTLLNGRYQTT